MDFKAEDDGLEKPRFKNAKECLHVSNLLTERHNDIFALKWCNIAQNYATSNLALYVLMNTPFYQRQATPFPVSYR